MPADSLLSVAISKSLFSFGLMAAIAMACAVFIRALVALLGLVNRRIAAAAPAPAPAAPVDAIDPAVIAAISAAVAAAIGPHRIVWIGEDHAGGWAADGRHRLHASHAPHHAR